MVNFQETLKGINLKENGKSTYAMNSPEDIPTTVKIPAVNFLNVQLHYGCPGWTFKMCIKRILTKLKRKYGYEVWDGRGRPSLGIVAILVSSHYSRCSYQYNSMPWCFHMVQSTLFMKPNTLLYYKSITFFVFKFYLLLLLQNHVFGLFELSF